MGTVLYHPRVLKLLRSTYKSCILLGLADLKNCPKKLVGVIEAVSMYRSGRFLSLVLRLGSGASCGVAGSGTTGVLLEGNTSWSLLLSTQLETLGLS